MGIIIKHEVQKMITKEGIKYILDNRYFPWGNASIRRALKESFGRARFLPAIDVTETIVDDEKGLVEKIKGTKLRTSKLLEGMSEELLRAGWQYVLDINPEDNTILVGTNKIDGEIGCYRDTGIYKLEFDKKTAQVELVNIEKKPWHPKKIHT